MIYENHRVFYLISELIFVLDRDKDTSLSKNEFISSYQDTMSDCQRICTFVK